MSLNVIFSDMSLIHFRIIQYVVKCIYIMNQQDAEKKQIVVFYIFSIKDEKSWIECWSINRYKTGIFYFPMDVMALASSGSNLKVSSNFNSSTALLYSISNRRGFKTTLITASKPPALSMACSITVPVT
jgi:hypothetical protein